MRVVGVLIALAGALALQTTLAGLTIGGGRVIASGRVPFGGAEARLAASWRDVDLTALARATSSGVGVAPAGRTSGAIDASGKPGDSRTWVADGRLRVERPAGRYKPNHCGHGGRMAPPPL